MVQHERSNACMSPFWSGKDERNVGLIVTDIRHQESKRYDELLIENNAAEVWILKALRH